MTLGRVLRFDRKWNDRRRRKRTWHRWRWRVMLAAFVVLVIIMWGRGGFERQFDEPQAIGLSFPLCGAPTGYSSHCVVDGDTIRIGSRRIRLTGFDAPEMEGACPRESGLAIAAREELHRWLALGPFELSGGMDPPYDQYGRELREARRVGPDGSHSYLADHMIDQQLAEGGGWQVGGNPWC